MMCPNCKLPRFYGPMGLAAPQCMCMSVQVYQGASFLDAPAPAPEATPAQAQQVQSLTEDRINELRAIYMHDKSVPFVRMVEKACAEAWGVKLAGIGAKESGNA